jgi:PAS domain S-box-containing protein
MIQSWNQASSNVFQYGRDIVGQSYQQLLWSTAERAAIESWLPQVFEQKHSLSDVSASYKCKDGTQRFMISRLYPLFDHDGSVVVCVFANTDITARKHAEEQIQLQLQRLAALRMVDMAISGSLDLHVTLSVLLDQLASQLHIDAADVLLLNPRSQMLEYAASRGFRSYALQHTHLRLGEGYAGQVALERRVVYIRHLAEDVNGLSRAPLLSAEGFESYCGAPLVAKGRVIGVLEVFQRVVLDPDEEWLSFLETLARQAAIAIDNATLYSDLQRSNLELTQAYDATIEGWSRALDLRDRQTEDHTRRVAEITLRLARACAVDDAQLVHMRRGILLHDIGKMGIPDTILLKSDRLTPEEWEIMRRHPGYAREMLAPITYLRPALDIPYCHHEKWDGTGYPRGLSEEQIPLAARIFAVVDAWDALCSDRPYRAAWPKEQVREYLREHAGKHFDPQVVKAFLKMLDEE